MIADDCPDPDVLEVDGPHHAYAATYGRTNVRVATSEDLEDWPDAGRVASAPW